MVNNYAKAQKVWREIISGVVFKERLDEYESFIAYCKTARYLDTERHEYGEFDDDAIKIVADIKAGKTDTTDSYGTPVQIWSIDELELGALEDNKRWCLVRQPGKLFEIVVDKKVDDILKETTKDFFATDRARLTENTMMYVSELAKDYNFTIMSSNPYIPINEIMGTAVFVGYNQFDSDIESLDIEDALKIIHNMSFMLGNGVLDVRRF